ncbi:hypothetical protein HHI36_016121 [Cryptolaemus montrouzieri]|uniref:Thioredoxin domain-containing protein n=1 Tax=Cryptolaemus montrouzieri TaxID=559131 RepID=A0ABD2NJQ0_9CUCU
MHLYLSFMICEYFSFVLGHSEDTDSLQYTTENFSVELPKSNHFVMFYAPWCGHCQRLAPTWGKLAEMLNEEDYNIKVAKVDCTTDRQICSDHDITGYPTLKFFKKGSSDGEKFRGTRDLPTLTTFINEQLRKVENEEAQVGSLIVNELTDENFDNHIKEGKHFIMFYAPWCSQSQQLAPIWQDLAEMYHTNTSLTMAKVDCTKFKSICKQYNVILYPSLLWFENGERLEEVHGERNHGTLVDYIDEKLSEDDYYREDQKLKNEHSNIVNEDGVTELTASDFENGIQSGITFIKFFAPWCGHCKTLAPTWESLGKKYINNNLINIAKVDCTVQENKSLCNDEKVGGFPTIYLYKNGEKISEYSGSRSLEDLSRFVESHLGHDEL